MFGTGLRSPDGVAEFARRAEDLGFDVLGCGEHVMFHVPTANTFISLGVAAGATTRIRLLSAVVLLPLYPAALAAKMGAALDVASGGRYLFGVGVGGEFPKEFEACGVPVRERGARTNEALDVIRRLWTGRDVSYAGRFNTLNEFSLDPMPVQSPPPIWVAGRRDAAMKRAARFGDGWLPYMYTPEQLAASTEKIRAFGEEAGRDLEGFRFGLYIFTAVHEDGDRAREMADIAPQPPVRAGLLRPGGEVRPGGDPGRGEGAAPRVHRRRSQHGHAVLRLPGRLHRREHPPRRGGGDPRLPVAEPPPRRRGEPELPHILSVRDLAGGVAREGRAVVLLIPFAHNRVDWFAGRYQRRRKSLRPDRSPPRIRNRVRWVWSMIPLSRWSRPAISRSNTDVVGM